MYQHHRCPWDSMEPYMGGAKQNFMLPSVCSILFCRYVAKHFFGYQGESQNSAHLEPIWGPSPTLPSQPPPQPLKDTYDQK